MKDVTIRPMRENVPITEIVSMGFAFVIQDTQVQFCFLLRYSFCIVMQLVEDKKIIINSRNAPLLKGIQPYPSFYPKFHF